MSASRTVLLKMTLKLQALLHIALYSNGMPVIRKTTHKLVNNLFENMEHKEENRILTDQMPISANPYLILSCGVRTLALLL